ncbi:MAG: FtsX-like permease family protein [Acetobacteraceae bacterium]
MSGVRLAAALALADARAELRLTVTAILGIAAVLAPLIVLFGLKAGVIDRLREALVETPRAREIVNQANRSFDAAFFARLAARPDVAFIVPRTRTLAAQGAFAASADADLAVRAELLATAPGDPLLAGLAIPDGRSVALSASLADRLGIGAGGTVRLRVDRVRGGIRETMGLDLAVAAVAPAASFGRDGAFLPLPLLLLVEDFQDGIAPREPPALDPPPDPARAYAGFRLHARALEDVPMLDRLLRGEGIDVFSRADEVGGLLLLDRNLTVLFLTIALLGGAGYLVSLGVGLYAGVERKRHELSLLRLMGLSARGLTVFPVTQAAVMGFAGAVLAGAVAHAVAAAVNRLTFAVGEGGRIAAIAPGHLLAALLLTVAGAVLAAGFAARRAAAIEPAEGIRDA